MTGLASLRSGVSNSRGLDLKYRILPQIFQDAGDRTWMCGKWHLEGPADSRRSGPDYLPHARGFDYFYGHLHGAIDYDAHERKDLSQLDWQRNGTPVFERVFSTDLLADDAIREVRSRDRTRSFFPYLPTHAIHAPYQPTDALLAKYRGKARREGANLDDAPYAATIEALDRNVGRLRTLLVERGLDDRTMLVFTSDNGGTPHHAAPLNGGKGALYEGGLRVPCVVWWRGMARPGRSTAEPVLSMDFYPTLAELAGAELPARQPIDGRSLTPLLLGTGGLDRDAVYWHFPCYVGRGKPASAIRSGDWKLIQHFESPSVELFHLGEDPGETRDLAAILPDRARELARQLADWQTALDAPCPAEANPAFDPRVGRSGGKAGGEPAPRSRPRGA